MVLHPDDAVAGADLMKVAKKSVNETLKDDEDAKAHGGVDKEMKRLISFADANEQDANHVTGTCLDDEHFQILNLSNIEAYSARHNGNNGKNKPMSEEDAKKHAQMVARKAALFAEKSKTQNLVSVSDFCPTNSKFGRDL